jgi:hypothetical protein
MTNFKKSFTEVSKEIFSDLLRREIPYISSRRGNNELRPPV